MSYSVSPPPPPAGASAGMTDPSNQVDVAELELWFDHLSAERVHPEAVRVSLLHAGWPEFAAGWATDRYRRRWPTHPGVWWGGFGAIGFGVLAWAGVIHSVIDGADTTAAAWFGIAVVATAFAVVGVVLIARHQHHWSQTFSVSRRGAASTLFWCTIAMAVVRGITYGTVLGLAIFAGQSEDLGPALGHLALTAVAAGPLAWWVWFSHQRRTDAPGVDERLADSNPERAPAGASVPVGSQPR